MHVFYAQRSLGTYKQRVDLSDINLRMTQFLPDNLLALFAPRPPIEFKAPPDNLLVDRKRAPITPVAQYVDLFEVVYPHVL